MSMSYSNKPEKARKYVKPVVTCTVEEGRTKQSFGPASDVNAIVARYEKTGIMDYVRQNPGVFSDVSQIPDYPEMIMKIRFAEESFEQLPAHLRKRFEFDPAKLVAFISDDSNRDEAVKLGLVPKEVVKLPAPVVVVPPVVPVAKAEPAKPASKAEPKAKD